MSDFWSNAEVEIIIADYFSMLQKEFQRKPYIKAEHRKALLQLLKNRSKGSIEFKHQNISAVLINLGLPYIKGYLPRFNYQGVLESKVVAFLKYKPEIELIFKEFSEKPIMSTVDIHKLENLLYDLPIVAKISESEERYLRNPFKVNYLEREQENMETGTSGESLVIEYEKWHLKKNGKEGLVDKIRWISKEEGDSAGFDVLSKHLNGKDKYIEVKTTKLGKETPFYFSSNELKFSKKHSNDYHLYRLFNFEDDAKMFIRNGGLDSICHITPTNYVGLIKT